MPPSEKTAMIIKVNFNFIGSRKNRRKGARSIGIDLQPLEVRTLPSVISVTDDTAADLGVAAIDAAAAADDTGVDAAAAADDTGVDAAAAADDTGVDAAA